MKKKERKEINKTFKKREKFKRKISFLKKNFFLLFSYVKKEKKGAQKENQKRDIFLKNFWSK
jgi:hypothetical protein